MFFTKIFEYPSVFTVPEHVARFTKAFLFFVQISDSLHKKGNVTSFDFANYAPKLFTNSE